MPYLKWEDRYTVFNDEIDSQHKQVVEMINRLYDNLHSKDSNQLLREVIIKLVKFTNSHLKYEENLLHDINHPELPRQQAQHQRLLKETKRILQVIKDGKELKPQELLSVLGNWWITHILEEDLKFAPALKKIRESSKIPAA